MSVEQAEQVSQQAPERTEKTERPAKPEKTSRAEKTQDGTPQPRRSSARTQQAPAQESQQPDSHDSGSNSGSDRGAEGGSNGGSDGDSDSGGSYEAGEVGEDGQRREPGTGQSKSSRRRRRKRKGKSEEGPGQAAGGPQEGGSDAGESFQASAQDNSQSGNQDSSAPAPMVLPGESISARQSSGNSTPQQPQQPRGFNGNGQSSGQNQNGNQNGGQNSNAPGGTKRWKKKNFRDRERPGRNENSGNNPGQNPGNSFAASGDSGGNQQGGQGGGQNQPRNHQGGGNHGGQSNRGADTHQPGNNAFKRKGGGGGGGFGGGGKQRSGGGSRGGFVGPMDHSYRAPNGNVFDPSASTVEMGGRRSSHQGDSQPIDYSMGRAIPIKEGAPTRIYFFIEDLFFTAKIQETARKLGVKIAFIKNEKEQIATLLASPEDERPGLIVFDLSNANAKPMTLIPKLKAKLKKSTSIVGFLSTLQGELRAKAVEAGCDTVMPRAAFSQNLPNLLRRYGIEEVEDHTNFNQ